MTKAAKARLVSSIGLHAFALFEAAKGIIVLLAGFGIVSVIPEDSREVAERWVHHMHLNPAGHYPRIFLDLASRVTDTQLWWLALVAFLYAAFRLLEAYGLWRERSWAEWVAVLSAGLYLPFEVYEIIRRATLFRVSLFGVNLTIVLFLIYVLRTGKERVATPLETEPGKG